MFFVLGKVSVESGKFNFSEHLQLIINIFVNGLPE